MDLLWVGLLTALIISSARSYVAFRRARQCTGLPDSARDLLRRASAAAVLETGGLLVFAIGNLIGLDRTLGQITAALAGVLLVAALSRFGSQFWRRQFSWGRTNAIPPE